MPPSTGLVKTSATGWSIDADDHRGDRLGGLRRSGARAWSNRRRAVDRVLAEVGGHHPRHHQGHVDARVGRREIHPEVGGQAVQRRLRRAVGGSNRGHRHAAEERRHVDDLSGAARPEMRQHRLHAVERRLHVDGDHLIELLVSHLFHLARHAAPGVVDPHVDRSELLERFVAQPLDGRARRDVGDHGQGVRAKTGGEPLELVLPPRREHDLVST